MKKMKSFFEKIKDNLKVQSIVFLICMVVLGGIYFVLQDYMEINKVINKKVEFDLKTFVDITNVSIENGQLNILGWGFRIDCEPINIKIILSAVDEEDIKILETEQIESKEFFKYVKYLNLKDISIKSGFKTNIKVDELKKDCSYKIQVYLSYQELETIGQKESKKIFTEKYLYNGKLYDFNPKEFVEPKFIDIQMMKVIEKGNLLGYNTEYGACVYLYEGSLYWILDKTIEKNLDENLYMFLHLNTTKMELLPENSKKIGFDNKDFYFNTFEIFMEQDSNYRVARVLLENQYPITYIATGHYADNKNLWVVRNKIVFQ